MVQAALCGAAIPYRQARQKSHNALTCFYLCADRRWLSLLVMQEQRDWPRFVQAIGQPRLAADPRFSEVGSRHANAAELVRELDAVFVERRAAEWQKRFEAVGLTVGVVARTEDALSDEQMRIAGALVPAPDVPSSGLTVDSPFQIAGVRKVPPRAAPGLGADTAAVLREYGFAAGDIDALQQAGVVS
jgi:formyl-CoA transferase